LKKEPTVLTLVLMVAHFASLGQQTSTTRSQPSDEVRRQVAQDLESHDPRTVAWGAYLAGVYQLTASVPTLQRMLESPPAMTAGGRSAFVDVVLDALIQLNARLTGHCVNRKFKRCVSSKRLSFVMGASQELE
jgi:hypothetical protein